MTATPSDISVLLHCHVSPTPHPRLGAPAVTEAIDRFLREGLIEPDKRFLREGLIEPDSLGCFKTTPRGRAWVEMLCAVPFPEQAWFNPVTLQVIGMPEQPG